MSYLDEVAKQPYNPALELELAWGIIANAFGGDWSQASPEWREAAEKWRDRWIKSPTTVTVADATRVIPSGLVRLHDWLEHWPDPTACDDLVLTGPQVMDIARELDGWRKLGKGETPERMTSEQYAVSQEASHFDKVQAFQTKFQLPIGKQPQSLVSDFSATGQAGVIVLLKQAEKLLQLKRGDNDVQWGRVQMMIEELREYCEAVVSGDLATAADSLVDLEYFLLGTAVMHGFPHDEVFDAVHYANMLKVLVESKEDSKRLNKLDVKKPDGWTPPNVAGILAAATERAGGS